MALNEKETAAIKELQTQEQTCIEKYKKYSNDANDTELKNLFDKIGKDEQGHYDTLGKVLSGTVPTCNCNDSKGANYSPKAKYNQIDNTQDKQTDNFLATDSIGTEKLVSGEYNSDIFTFSDPAIRKVLADIQVEEQNHAEMLYKYRTVNGMV